jgi:hypothetical protein
MKYKQGDLRVKAKWRRNEDGTEDKLQFLQVYERFLWGLLDYWHTIDEETIPKWAWIQSATLGYTDWKSKFTEYGKFGSDGYITKKEVK